MFERSFETQQMVEALQKLELGETITYDDLSRLTGIKITGDSGQLSTAREVVEREQGFALKAVVKVGIKRLTDGEIASESTSNRAIINRRARRNLHRLGAVQKFDAMTGEQKLEHQVNAITFATIVEKTSAAAIKEIEIAKSDGPALLAAIRQSKTS